MTPIPHPAPPLDDPVLRNEWLAVTTAEAVTATPVKVQVLGEDVVLWRSLNGLRAFRDLCIHRGTALSLGRVEGGTLVCPYHGWRYDDNGQCVAIPAQPGAPVPTKARAWTYRCRERYGIVWVCLGEPAGEPPPHLEQNDPAFRTIICGPYTVRAEAPRVIENFLDVSHLMWVHEGYLGVPSHAEVNEYRVTDHGSRLVSGPINIFQPDPDGRGKGLTNTYVYEILGPLSARFRKTDDAGSDVFSMLLTATPTTRGATTAYALLSRNYAFEVPDETFRDFQDKIFAQDVRIMLSQRPEQLPLDLAAELHLKSDRLAIAYRQWLSKLGVRVGVA